MKPRVNALLQILVLCILLVLAISGCTPDTPVSPQDTFQPSPPPAPDNTGLGQSTTVQNNDEKTYTGIDYSKLDKYGDEVKAAIIDAIGIKRYQLIRDGIEKPTEKEAEIIASCISTYDTLPKNPPANSPAQPQPQPEKTGDLMYEIYPVTDAAPVLELYWGPPDLSMDNIARFTPYGIWEGPYEPAVEMQFYTFSSHDPVYAPCAGTIVHIWQGVDPATHNQQYAVTMRYGRNYGIVLHHLVDVPAGLKAGDKVEARTLIGYTQGQMGVGWWEIEVAARVGNVVRTQPPYDFFSPQSKEKLDAIIQAAKEKGPYSTWTVTQTTVPSNPAQGTGSWIQDMGGKKEWYTSGERLGLQYDPDTLEDFLKANNMEWLIPHLTGGTGQPGSPVSPAEPPKRKTPVISLPFSPTDIPYEMMPMGETINHPDGGHPGIDFMWDKSVDIIACADGTVIWAEKTTSHNKWDVYVKTDDIIIGYTTLETVEENIKAGSKITAGQKIGETGFFGHAMIHWELERELRGTRFCPMAYLDEVSRQRILDIWDKTKWPEMKGPFPHICNGNYRCDYCIKNGY